MQCAEKDEVTFQEMIAHLPLFCHPSPKNVCKTITIIIIIINNYI